MSSTVDGKDRGLFTIFVSGKLSPQLLNRIATFKGDHSGIYSKYFNYHEYQTDCRYYKVNFFAISLTLSLLVTFAYFT